MNARNDLRLIVGIFGIVISASGPALNVSARADSGQYTFVTLAGGNERGADGVGGSAQFLGPLGLATDAEGNVYVADSGNGTVRKITPNGLVTTLAGVVGNPWTPDPAAIEARLRKPAGVGVDAAGNVYVADSDFCTIRKITSTGGLSTVAGLADKPGFADGTGSDARFAYPSGVAVDHADNIYIADSGNQIIRKITAAGEVSTLAGQPNVRGSADGTGHDARFYNPSGIAVDRAGHVYVADTENNTIRRITSAGVVSTLAGSPDSGKGNADGVGSDARFSGPWGVGVDAEGNIYVADTGNHTIRKLSPQGVVGTVAGLAGNSGTADGTGTEARFASPQGIATDSEGNVYVADFENNTVRKINSSGAVTTLVVPQWVLTALVVGRGLIILFV